MKSDSNETSYSHDPALIKRFVVNTTVERCDEFLAQFRKFLIGSNP